MDHDVLTLEQLFDVMRDRGLISDGPPAYLRNLNMYWDRAARSLSERATCQFEGCKQPATRIMALTDGRFGSETFPVQVCEAHICRRRLLARWTGITWDLLLRATWEESEGPPA